MRVVVGFLRYPKFQSGSFFKFASLPAKVARKGFRCLAYLDDLLFLVQRNAFTSRRIAMLRNLLSCFGLSINEAKSHFTPRQRFDHLGLVVDLHKRAFSAPPLKVAKLRAQALDLARFAALHRRWVNKKLLAKFVGTAISLSPAVPTTRFRLVALYESINSNPDWSPATFVRLSNQAYRSLVHFWTQLKSSECTCMWDPATPAKMLFIDASDFGLGAHTSDIAPSAVVSGLWNVPDSS